MKLSQEYLMYKVNHRVYQQIEGLVKGYEGKPNTKENRLNLQNGIQNILVKDAIPLICMVKDNKVQFQLIFTDYWASLIVDDFYIGLDQPQGVEVFTEEETKVMAVVANTVNEVALYKISPRGMMVTGKPFHIEKGFPTEQAMYDYAREKTTYKPQSKP